MTRFQPGQVFNVRKWGDFGETAYGTCEIVAVTERPESEIEWRELTIKGNLDADLGTITFILKTASNNSKPKKARLIGSKVSEAWEKEYGTEREYQWFSPTKRSYRPITSGRDFAGVGA